MDEATRVQNGPDSGPIELSILVPVLDERDNLRPLFQAICAALDPHPLRYEVIFVDDGSRDGSTQILEDLHAEHPALVAVVLLLRNFGKAAAYVAGIEHARGALVVMLDADLQDDPAEIPRFLARLGKDCDLVSGWRRPRADAFGKRVLSRFFNVVTRSLTGVPVHDINCGLKAARREVLEQVPLYGDLHRYLPALAHLEGFRVGELPVRHHPRLHQQSKYGGGRLLRGFLDLLSVLVLGRYLSRPLHLFGSLGLACGLAGVSIDVFILRLWLESGHIHGRHPLLLLGILLTVLGVQLVCTGLLAEMILRRSRPRADYRVRRVLASGGGPARSE